jgi:hypothetical protein
MTALGASTSASADALDHYHHLQECVGALSKSGWEDRLYPLATHMATKALVRGRGEHGAPLRRLDVALLREALSRLLHDEWASGYVVYLLAVIGADVHMVAIERRVSRAVLVEQLRDAVDDLALAYEDVPYASVGERKQERVPAAPVRKH